MRRAGFYFLKQRYYDYFRAPAVTRRTNASARMARDLLFVIWQQQSLFGLGSNHYQRAERLCALRFAGNTLDVRGERGRSQSQQGGTVKREPIRVDRSLP